MLDPKPKYFPDSQRLRIWFVNNHESKSEQWIGFYKTKSGRKSITWPQSVDEALCFGWIDGLRKSIDEQAYMIRFTPRRARSHWSAVNLKRMAELKKLGLLYPAGLAAFNSRDATKVNQYAYERTNAELPPSFVEKLKDNRKAWEFFERLPPSTKKPTIWWVISAKKVDTKLRRLQVLIECCQANERIPHLRRPTKIRKKK